MGVPATGCRGRKDITQCIRRSEWRAQTVSDFSGHSGMSRRLVPAFRHLPTGDCRRSDLANTQRKC